MQYFSLIYLIIALKYCSCCTLRKKESVTGSKNAADNIDSVIIGGNKAPPNKYPWLVIVRHRIYGDMCSGSIISKTHVLTAAHCTFIGPFKQSGPPSDKNGRITDKTLLAGYSIEAGSTEIDKPLETFKVKEIIRHPEYSARGIRGSSDVAIIKLSKPITFSENIKEVCLPENRCLETNTRSADIVGWGTVGHKVRTDHLMEGIKVTVWKSQECASALEVPISEHAVCAGGKGGPTPCPGDSGGPLIVHKFQKDYVLGVVSHGEPICSKKSPVVFSSVSPFLEWIRRNSDYDARRDCNFPSGYSC